MSTNKDTFSHRHGFASEPAEITIREDAPLDVRTAVLSIAEGELDLSRKDVRAILCTVLRQLPDANNWSPDPIWNECLWTMVHRGSKIGAAAHMYKKKTGVYPTGFEGIPRGKAEWNMLANEFVEQRGA